MIPNRHTMPVVTNNFMTNLEFSVRILILVKGLVIMRLARLG
jgi:hypothetical protein